MVPAGGVVDTAVAPGPSKALPHSPSYYAATRNDDSSYAPLAGDRQADVCVIGGGFTGIAAALTLAERGYRVCLLEQHRIGWGASGRNGGQLIGGMSGEKNLLDHWGPRIADTLFAIGYRGHDIIAERVDRYAIDCDLKYGYMDVAVRPRHLLDQQVWYEDLCSRGMEQQVRLVPREELSGLLGTDRYLGGLINNRNGHLHPLNLCLGEARAAAGLGVSIHEGTAVTDIIPGSKPVVVSPGGRVTADFVVLAGNAYLSLRPKSLSGLVFPAGSFIIGTEPLTEEEVAAINPLDLAVCDQNEVLDYFRLSADRRMLFGGRCNYSGREPRSIEGAMRPRMCRIFPQLAEKRVDYAWGGKIGIVPNRVPLLGRVGPNIFYAMGYSGHGVNMSHVCGEIMADVVAGTFERMDVFAAMPHRRIPLGQWFGNQLVAMGMLYYRLRDML
jgi:glycine/D-amino acid oxidase-like deaminating enzyme